MSDKKLTIEDIEVELSNAVYLAALWFERAEGAGLIHGNGYHMAQDLAQEAVNRLRARIPQPPAESPARTTKEGE